MGYREGRHWADCTDFDCVSFNYGYLKGHLEYGDWKGNMALDSGFFLLSLFILNEAF